METKLENNSMMEEPGKPDTVAVNAITEVAELEAVDKKAADEKTVEAEPAKTTGATSVADAVLQRIAAKKAQKAEIEGKPVPQIEVATVADSIEETEVLAKLASEVYIGDEAHAGVDDETLAVIEEVQDELGEVDHESLQVNYATKSKEELIDALKTLIEQPIQTIKGDVETIKIAFYKKHNAEIQEKKQAFLDNGGNVEEFQVETDPLEESLKDLYKKYKHLRTAFNEQIEHEKHDNLKEKYQIIESIRDLINRKESINNTFAEFRELQHRWREIGPVPQADVKPLWETYHHHVENFYDYININKELRDLDLRKNLEIKIELCEKAEELLLEPNVVKAFKNLQKLHAQWREAGPVPREKKDEIWERFKLVTTNINKSYQDHFENIKNEQENNLNAKVALCEKAEEISEATYTSPRDWDNKSKELIELQKVWKIIGFAPKKDNNRIYIRFRTACDKFFAAKRDFFSLNKEEQNGNLQLKTELCLQAEALMDSTEWKKTTEILTNLQKDWKTIGPVPRKHSDIIWKRFRTACNSFFERKDSHFKELDAAQDENLIKKRDLIQRIESFEFTDSPEENLDKLKEFQKEWTEIGHVPLKEKDDVQMAYRGAINAKFDSLRSNENRRSEARFKSKIENLQQSPKGSNKMRFEREKLINKLRQVEGDIVVWENNIGFFAHSKNAESLILDVKNKIEAAKALALSLREKVELMDNMM
jgi:hypothetical protein